MPRSRGYFLSFEGGEGVGKSTQTELLCRRLTQAGHPVTMTREPGGTAVGERVREILLYGASRRWGMDLVCADLDKDANWENEDWSASDRPNLAPFSEALLYGMDRAEHIRSVIRPALADGRMVLCDRFADSTLAYQGYAAADGDGRAGEGAQEAECERIAALNRLVVGEDWPDITFILDMPAPTALERVATRKGEFSWYDRRPTDFHERLRRAFLRIAEENPRRCVVVEAAADPQAVAERIASACRERLSLELP